MRFIIFGFTGSGKSTKLEELKKRPIHTEYDYIDLDTYILDKFPAYESLGLLIDEISFDKFRVEESNALNELLNRDNIYLALGGGSVNRALIEKLKGIEFEAIYLDLSFEQCWERIKNDPNRPIVKAGKEECQRLYFERTKLFKELSGL